MADFHCNYCGKYGYGKPVGGPASGASRPDGWLQNKSWGFGIKYYCSKKCKLEDEQTESNSNKSEKKSSNVETITSIPKTAEQIRAEHEAEMEERKIRKEKEEQETAERKIKSLKYKEKGWNFIAWLIEINPVYSICLLAYPFLFLLAPGNLKLIGIISLFILIALIIKDIAKLSWKIFSIIIVSMVALLIGYILFIHKSEEQLFDEELNQVENSNENQINNSLDVTSQPNAVIVQENNEEKESSIEEKNNFVEAQDDITVEGIEDKIYFYNNPTNESITKGYFIKGQRGKLLGSSGDFSKVHFEFNGKITEKYVLTNQITEVYDDTQNENEQ